MPQNRPTVTTPKTRSGVRRTATRSLCRVAMQLRAEPSILLCAVYRDVIEVERDLLRAVYRNFVAVERDRLCALPRGLSRERARLPRGPLVGGDAQGRGLRCYEGELGSPLGLIPG